MNLHLTSKKDKGRVFIHTELKNNPEVYNKNIYFYLTIFYLASREDRAKPIPSWQLQLSEKTKTILFFFLLLKFEGHNQYARRDEYTLTFSL